VSLRLDPKVADRHEVRWSATCLITRRGEAAPAMFGESGAYEVVRRGGQWRVSRALAHFAH
jgi:hypothetical protein